MVTQEEYKIACERAMALAYMDPDKPTAESDELLKLCEEIEEYEREHYPLWFRK